LASRSRRSLYGHWMRPENRRPAPRLERDRQVRRADDERLPFERFGRLDPDGVEDRRRDVDQPDDVRGNGRCDARSADRERDVDELVVERLRVLDATVIEELLAWSEWKTVIVSSRSNASNNRPRLSSS
jgi:hypothetical protein